MLNPEEFEPFHQSELGGEQTKFEKGRGGEESEIEKFFKNREISPEDFELVKSISQFPKEWINGFHNFFNLSRERSAQELRGQIGYTKYEKKKTFLQPLLTFVEKYDWTTSWNLVRVVEERNARKNREGKNQVERTALSGKHGSRTSIILM